MTAPLDVTGTAAEAQPEAVLQGVGAKAIQGRSLGQIAWTRLKRDKVAIAGAVIVVLLVLVAALAERPFGGLIALFGDDPNVPNQDAIDPLTSAPLAPWGGISLEHPLGLEPVNGRDIFARILSGAQISLLVAFLATLLSVIIGTLMGVLAGYFGGWIDTIISRLMDMFLAFPLLLFAIAIVGAMPDRAFGLSGNGLRIGVIVFIIGFFSWPYIARIVRGQTLSLKEREFVDAARSLGATNGHIIFKEVLPNLVAPILVYSTLLIPTNILFEAALSFLGVGVAEPQASWGGMLTRAVDYYQSAPHFMIIPGLAIFITVMAFNLLGDGLRDALDPRNR
ncbi:ABC transporter permease [Nonomuraea soli]|uniref:Peptide/nickel transport system permease protein/oligopeptide transport system permease protein n=1 Tax=Nonomuraea soli TaxID=1032476 RepID=A0A7W0CRT3_9ACTN|nr:ABC transporter permease [Nonomuraea soli]MBA2896085.1 peptide/nickel transport system permease protein/oligopeptide transport system permease protein [Nonomuraea soli]